MPITYGLSALSSVIGATCAMTLMINLGFNSLLLQAAAAYAALGLLIVLYSLVARRNVLKI